MMSMLDEATFLAAIAPLEVYASVAKKAGYYGVEYFPFRIPHLQVKTRLVTNHALKSIHSAHQNLRTETGRVERKGHPNPKLALQGFIVLPEKVASLADLEKLQGILGDVPVIVYLHNEWDGENEPEAFNRLTNKLIQPSPELIYKFGQDFDQA